MTSEDEKLNAIFRGAAQCRAALVREHAKDEEDLLDISKAFLNEAITILVGLFDEEEAADRLAAAAADIRAAGQQTPGVPE